MKKSSAGNTGLNRKLSVNIDAEHIIHKQLDYITASEFLTGCIFYTHFYERMIYMWTEKTKNGKYKHVERYTDPITGKTRKISVTTEKNTAQARKSAQWALLTKIDALLGEKGTSDITLGELRERWLESKHKSWKESSYSVESANSHKVVELLGEDSIVNNLTARYVKEHIVQPDEDIELIGRRIALFKRIINWGYANDYVEDKSYLEKLKSKQSSTDTKEDDSEDIEEKYLESWQVQKLIKEMENEHRKRLTQFLVLTEMRVGEAFSLTSEDIDLKNRYIYVSHTYDHVNKLSTTPKTKSSKRKIYIQDELFPLAKELKKEALANKLACGQDLVFMKNERPVCYQTYREYLVKSSEKILGRKITPHTLRHTHTSLLAEQGVDIEIISRRLGHEDSHITRKIYLHVTEKTRQKDNEQIQNINIL